MTEKNREKLFALLIVSLVALVGLAGIIKGNAPYGALSVPVVDRQLNSFEPNQNEYRVKPWKNENLEGVTKPCALPDLSIRNLPVAICRNDGGKVIEGQYQLHTPPKKSLTYAEAKERGKRTDISQEPIA